MTDEKTGNTVPPVSPESFFTDDQVGTAQQPTTPADAGTTQPSSTEGEPQWDGAAWKFKAAGKEWTPKDRAELLTWASFGVNYEQKAQTLNRQKAEILAMKKEMETQKETPAPKQEVAPDPFAAQSDPELAALKAKIAELESGVKSSLGYAEKQQLTETDAALESGLEALTKEGVELSESDTDELFLELQDRIDSLSDKAVDSPDKIIRLMKAVYYDLHPDAIDSIVEKRANTRLDELKKSISGKTVVEGGSAGAARGTPKPKDFREAGERLEGAWDSLG
jgi:hypothetical protein